MRLKEIGNTKNLNKFIFDFKEKYINKKLNKEFYQRLIPKMDNFFMPQSHLFLLSIM